MSYDLVVWYDPAREWAGRADERYEQLADLAESGEPSRALAGVLVELLTELARRWPWDGDTPWTSWPPDAVGDSALWLTIAFDRAPEVVPGVVALARERGLVVYDPQRVPARQPSRSSWRALVVPLLSALVPLAILVVMLRARF